MRPDVARYLIRMNRISFIKTPMLLTAYVIGAAVAFDPLAYLLSYEVFYGFGSRLTMFLLQTSPGIWFIPREMNLDTFVELTKSLGRTAAMLILLMIGMGLSYSLGRQQKAARA
jgi:hypothetical protein